MQKLSVSYALVLGLLTAIGPICTDLYLPALPDMTQQMGTTTSLTQLSLTASLIGLGLGQLFFGPLSDRLGRRLPLLLSLALFIGASVLCATSEDIHLLILWRFIQGFSGAGGSVLSRSIARDKYSGTQLTRFFALLMTVNGIAPVISPVLGGYIAETLHWRALFWSMALAGAVLFLLSLTVIKETRQPQNTPESMLNTLRAVLKNRTFLGFCFVQAFMLAGLFSYIGASSFVLQNEYGMSPMQFSLLFGINGTGLIISALIFSSLARRIPQDVLLKRGLMLAVLTSLITFGLAQNNHQTLALVGLFFTVAFNSGVCTLAGSAAMSCVEARYSGSASALLGMLMFVFGGIATPLSGLGGEAMWKMTLAIAIAYAAALAIYALARRQH